MPNILFNPNNSKINDNPNIPNTLILSNISNIPNIPNASNIPNTHNTQSVVERLKDLNMHTHTHPLDSDSLAY